MSKIATSVLFVNVIMSLCVAVCPAKADTGANCVSGNSQSNVTITIQNVNGSYQANPNAACVTHAATITWTAADPTWKWIIFFLSDSASPFKTNHRWHDENNPTDTVSLSSLNCSGQNPCTFVYYGLVIDSAGGKHIIDPKVIVNPVQVPVKHKKKKHE